MVGVAQASFPRTAAVAGRRRAAPPCRRLRTVEVEGFDLPDMRMKPRLALILLSLFALAPTAAGASGSAVRSRQSATARVALLDLGATRTGARVGERLAKLLAASGGRAGLVVLDRGMSGAGAR